MDRLFHSLRRQYNKGALRKNQVDKYPLKQLEIWISGAIQAGCPEPSAMVLSTAGKDLRPTSRMVLMKGLDEHGIVFFTNYESRKGRQLLENQYASILFFWPKLERQIRIEGTVSKVTPEESDAYFDTRPDASRISAIISPQSREIPGRDWLEERWKTAQGSGLRAQGTGWEEAGAGINEERGRPLHWGGYRLIPDYFEFWQGRAERLHDRIAYQHTNSGWRIFRLAP